MSDRQRIVSVDILRGLVMIIMALDHVRNYFSSTPVAPENLDDPGLALFLTRWVTHFCAPVFILLCGTSAWLHARNAGLALPELRRFLVTRGIWMLFVEIFIINALWPLWLDGYILLQVIWAIGWSMLALACVLTLGRVVITILGVIIIIGHNLLDGITATSLGAFAPAWQFLHEESVIVLGAGWKLYLAYPVLPWIGTIFIGYGFGSLLTEGHDWKRIAQRSGIAAILLFIGLRLHGLYGDPSVFMPGNTPRDTLISFLNTEKYPPSLQYLLMTLGPALLILPWLETWKGRVAGWISLFGRVPFFYYILHFALIYALAIFASLLMYGEAFWWFRGAAAFPEGHVLALWPTYVVWIGVVLSLHLPCRWYARIRQERRDLWWLSYL
jgi:uncharacterized membrane protein